MRVTKNKFTKFGQVLLYSFSYPGFAKRSLGQLYNSIAIAEGKIPACPINELVPRTPDIELRLFEPPVEGNASGFEIACLCALVRHLRPSVILEIGTFNGNTTLQLAANTPPATRIYTLDLPWDARTSPEAEAAGDVAFIASEKRKALRFVSTDQESKIKRLYGDSLSVNFSDLLGGEKADFIFVDAGHSYECVRNDSEKSFSVLNKGGVIVWHDYGASWPSVYKYLNELSKRKNLRNIEGTELVVYTDA
jgi:predicted O-methyltransferase YrrM